MAKKKTHKKRHHVKAKKNPNTPVAAIQTSPAEVASNITEMSSVTAPVVKNTTSGLESKLGYVRRDIMRIAVLVVGFVLLQLVLWYLFDHTGLGSTVYNWVKL